MALNSVPMTARRTDGVNSRVRGGSCMNTIVSRSSILFIAIVSPETILAWALTYSYSVAANALL
jgi:hypothetical protein